MFPISVARDLPKLEILTLEDLPQLKQVFGHEREGDVRNENYIVLSKLRKVSLNNLIELGSLYGGNGSLVWPSLEDLHVMNCPKMESSFFADVEAYVQTLEKVILYILLSFFCFCIFIHKNLCIGGGLNFE